MRFPFIALIIIPFICRAESVFIEPAGISLDRPANWEKLTKDSFPNAPSNVCFPRLQQGGSRIDFVIWKDAPSLENALDQYMARLPTFFPKGTTCNELKRESFRTSSEIPGLMIIFETTRPTDCGVMTTRFSRYIFRNKRGEIVCLGGLGDLERIHEVVLASLILK